MEQPAGGRSKTHYGGAGEMSAAKAAVAEQGQLVVEAGSPINSRLRASAMVNLDELMTQFDAATTAEDALVDRGDGGGFSCQPKCCEQSYQSMDWEAVLLEVL
ncbi:hypothetical protein ACFX1Q_027773 [Malus domestica]